MPGKGPIDSAWQLFLNQGVVGAVALLAIVALIWVTKALLKAKDDSISDQKKFAEVLQKTIENSKTLAVEINKSTSEASAEVVKTAEALKATVLSLEKTVDGLDKSIDNLKDEQVRLSAVLSARRS